VTYTVKPGDNLTVIAAWFHLHGYGDLYDANKSVIGANPALIRPGQVITVSSAGLTIG
jgi:nucleoid-associated protein YgaU